MRLHPRQVLDSALARLRESLHEGGVVYVAFKDARLYTTPEYQWLVDWFFLQRTDEDCRKLFEQAGYNVDELDSMRDETGIIINYIAPAKYRRSCGWMRRGIARAPARKCRRRRTSIASDSTRGPFRAMQQVQPRRHVPNRSGRAAGVGRCATRMAESSSRRRRRLAGASWRLRNRPGRRAVQSAHWCRRYSCRRRRAPKRSPPATAARQTHSRQ